jgi:hypothetical protein
MENYDRIDYELRALVRSAERDIPPAVENKIRIAAHGLQPLPRRRFSPSPLVLTFAVGVAALILAIMCIVPSLRRNETQQIAEIRTEFVIVDKNITIIFVQKPDFPIFVTAF